MAQIDTLDETLRQAMDRVPISDAYLEAQDRMNTSFDNLGIAPGLNIGERAPHFVLRNAFDKSVSLADCLERGPVVISFYRGDWCPLCNLELMAQQRIFEQIRAVGGSLLAIAPQTPESAHSLSEKHSLGFDLLSDPDQQVIRDYRLQYTLTDEMKRIYLDQLHLDVTLRNANGSWDLPIPATFVIDSGGFVRARSVSKNVLERMEPALIAKTVHSLSYFKAIFLNAPMPITILDSHGTIIDHNPAAQKLFDDPENQTAFNHFLNVPEGESNLGLNLLDHSGFKDTEPIAMIRRVLAGNSELEELQHVNLVPIPAGSHQARAGSIVNFSVAPLLLAEDIVGAICTFDDVTEKVMQARELEDTLNHLKTAQAQLVQSEKMASLGQLVAGIAHEIKNPLNFVTNFADVSVELVDELKEMMLERKPQIDNQSFEYMEALLTDLSRNAGLIHQHGVRADSVIRSMMALARSDAGPQEDIDINAFVDRYGSIAWKAATDREDLPEITFEKHLTSESVTIKGTSRNLSRVLMNLVKNAVEAVFYRAQTEDASYESVVSITTEVDDSGAVIKIRDNGHGIAEEHRGRIFDPFFTTRPPGTDNIGLGLSMSFDIISSEHGGSLEYHQINGHTEFIIRLPQTPPRAGSA